MTLRDFFPSPQVRSLARTDEARGLLWLLEEEALVPGATEDTLLERIFSYYGPQEGDKKGGYPWRAAPRFTLLRTWLCIYGSNWPCLGWGSLSPWALGWGGPGH